MANCKSCGAEVSRLGIYCPKCGASLRTPPPRPEAPAPDFASEPAPGLPEDLPTGLLSCNGRSGRGAWWAFTAISMVFYIAAIIGACIFAFREIDPQSINPQDAEQMKTLTSVCTFWALVFMAPVRLFLGLFQLPLCVRRWHDHGCSGWFVQLFQLITPVPLLGWISGLVQFVFLGCLSGKPHANKYGRAKGEHANDVASDTPTVFVKENAALLWITYYVLEILILAVMALPLIKNACALES